MKQPTGYAPPRRLVKPRKKVRLDLKRGPKREPEDELETKQKGNFGKWVALVALFHILIIGLVTWIYENSSTSKPPEQFITLLPQGNIVKGTPGTQEAHKIGATTAASVTHHTAAHPPTPSPVVPPKPVTPPPTAVVPPQPVQPKPPTPPVIPKADAPHAATVKPAPKTPPKPTPPKTHKVKVDLSKLEDAPASDNKPVAKPKHVKKSVTKTHADDTDSEDQETSTESTGLSKEKIAAKLGEKSEPAGVKNATKSGASGSVNAHPNSFADFYASIRDQVMSQWESPNLTDETAVNPIVQIHVDRDGRVPVESVHLVQSSGNPTYDNSALTAAKNLGFLHEPLPEGCPPDIPITFKLTR
jgi:TonB family protein